MISHFCAVQRDWNRPRFQCASGPGNHSEPQSVGHARYVEHPAHFALGIALQPELLRGHSQDQLRFHESEVVPDAQARSASEREVGELHLRSHIAGGEPGGVELVRLRPPCRPTLSHVGTGPPSLQLECGIRQFHRRQLRRAQKPMPEDRAAWTREAPSAYIAGAGDHQNVASGPGEPYPPPHRTGALRPDSLRTDTRSKAPVPEASNDLRAAWSAAHPLPAGRSCPLRFPGRARQGTG